MSFPIHLPKEVTEAMHALPEAMDHMQNMSDNMDDVKYLLKEILLELRKARGWMDPADPMRRMPG